MKQQDAPEMKWVGTDVHVHTPASKDYKGSRDQSEYLRLIQTANQFESAKATGRNRVRRDNKPNSIGCVAFTDHNSVDGFRNYRGIVDETEALSKAIRIRDPKNPLASQLEKDLEVFRSIRVLMGVEIKADPGIHVLILFAESVDPAEAAAFLEKAYEAPYAQFAGDPKPSTRNTLKQTLDDIEATFPEKAMVIFPHVDSSGGVYEDLKEFQQVRIAALTHPIVRALSFNRQETRERLIELFKQPDYQRPQPVALIQSSDFHGDQGSLIGQPRTDVSVREGRATFKNLRESFRDHKRIKCSIDFVYEEYQNLIRDKFLAKYASPPGKMEFDKTDFESVSENLCAMLNSSGGIIELEGSVGAVPEGQAPWTSVREQIVSILRGRLNPTFEPLLFRSFQLSPSKMKIICRITKSNRLHVSSGKVFIDETGKPKPADPIEIEYTVAKNMDSRFGSRFEATLARVSTQSSLLSRLPHGIPLIIGAQKKVKFSLPDTFKLITIDPASDKGTEASEFVDDLIEREDEEFTFGNPAGNATLVTGNIPFRERDHYLRFTLRRAEVDDECLRKYACGRIEQPGIIFYFSGFVGFVEEGYIVSDIPAVLLQLDETWQKHVLALTSWFKSSFFHWYCSVRLGIPTPFIELQRAPYRFPLPLPQEIDFLRAMDAHAKSIISAENHFMNDLNRQKRKGNLDSEFQEKSRQRHNSTGNRISLSIDKEIYTFLALDDKDRRFISETLRDIGVTDFGLLDELKATEHDD